MVEEKKLKTVNIKGKEYVEVNERVKYFIRSGNYDGWSIETELLSNCDGVCVFKALIKDEDGRTMATGHAYEKETSSFINKTSYIENCETSAVGRALGFLGIGIDTSIASSDEVVNAMNNQGSKASQKVDFKQIREKLQTISSLEDLTNYWNDLHLTDKQASVIKSDFTARRVELTMAGGSDGME